MRLTKLKLAGFKSFVDPTTVSLPGQLVGVVGPNGCGKSNIMDAVRWVLGESKASELRGESMQDVIFNGSSNRKPVSRASVELIFDNLLGRALGQWSQYTELSVKRVLTRTGQSDYFINNGLSAIAGSSTGELGRRPHQPANHAIRRKPFDGRTLRFIKRLDIGLQQSDRVANPLPGQRQAFRQRVDGHDAQATRHQRLCGKTEAAADFQHTTARHQRCHPVVIPMTGVGQPLVFPVSNEVGDGPTAHAPSFLA
jgi:energy-coupling factor transporter ATP-binding protein EcfA2